MEIQCFSQSLVCDNISNTPTHENVIMYESIIQPQLGFIVALFFLCFVARPNVQQSPPSTLTPLPDSRVELACQADAPSGGTIIRYRWTRDSALVGSAEREEGTLLIPAVREDQSDNGLYECSFVVTIGSTDAAPLVIPVATTLLTVGGMCITYCTHIYTVPSGTSFKAH